MNTRQKKNNKFNTIRKNNKWNTINNLLFYEEQIYCFHMSYTSFFHLIKSSIRFIKISERLFLAISQSATKESWSINGESISEFRSILKRKFKLIRAAKSIKQRSKIFSINLCQVSDCSKKVPPPAVYHSSTYMHSGRPEHPLVEALVKVITEIRVFLRASSPLSLNINMT